MTRPVGRLSLLLLVSLFALLLLEVTATASAVSSQRLFTTTVFYNTSIIHLCEISPSPSAPDNGISIVANVVEDKDDKLNSDDALASDHKAELSPACYYSLKRTTTKRLRPSVGRSLVFHTPAVFLITGRIRI